MVIPEMSLQMTAKDRTGRYQIKNRYCPQDAVLRSDANSCLSFDCSGKIERRCPGFSQELTGVKFCRRKDDGLA